MIVSVKCPYCGFENKFDFQPDKYIVRRNLTMCENKECDESFVVRFDVEIKTKVSKLNFVEGN